MWLDTVLTIEAAAAFWLSTLNTALLVRAATAARTRARRFAAISLGGMCCAQALEALLYLSTAPDTSSMDGVAATAALVVRSLLVVSAACLTLLLRRGLSRRTERRDDAA